VRLAATRQLLECGSQRLRIDIDERNAEAFGCKSQRAC
jgi:hypothetical protein